MKYSALVLATTLLAAPTWALAENAKETSSKQVIAEQPVQQEATADIAHQHHQMLSHHGYQAHKGQGSKYHHGYQEKQMKPERFAKYLDKRLAKLDNSELKAQFIKASQARLTAQAEQAQLRMLMAKHKANQLEDKAIKEATLEKIAADYKLKQLRNQQLQDLLTKAKQ
ncbi:efflux RND transporter periplasmic adaptor subunit [Oceanisphaera avium]|uniref:Zinc resistance-associated protein n=1 Tax=Oceanisphaera avium TaxID=1903694 RepID=A0A1Y0CYF8_9GAMM|nr:hypothetical protein [Oceanisphaera avium]ART80288.1 hypothetical protein CBP12_09125 [Oceanisphaera avium]